MAVTCAMALLESNGRGHKGGELVASQGIPSSHGTLIRRPASEADGFLRGRQSLNAHGWRADRRGRVAAALFSGGKRCALGLLGDKGCPRADE